jgi:hypothetical protein
MQVVTAVEARLQPVRVRRVAQHGIEVRHAIGFFGRTNPLIDCTTHRLLLGRMKHERAIFRVDRVIWR